MNIRLCLNEDPMQLQRVQDVFTRLSNEELLKRCLDKWTTNYNEAFNSKLWQNLPKHIFFAFPMMELQCVNQFCPIIWVMKMAIC